MRRFTAYEARTIRFLVRNIVQVELVVAGAQMFLKRSVPVACELTHTLHHHQETEASIVDDCATGNPLGSPGPLGGLRRHRTSRRVGRVERLTASHCGRNGLGRMRRCRP